MKPAGLNYIDRTLRFPERFRHESSAGHTPGGLRVSGAPGMTRTCDLLVRSQTLYPTELRARYGNLLRATKLRLGAWRCKNVQSPVYYSGRMVRLSDDAREDSKDGKCSEPDCGASNRRSYATTESANSACCHLRGQAIINNWRRHPSAGEPLPTLTRRA
jgi:hypothetical protein